MHLVSVFFSVLKNFISELNKISYKINVLNFCRYAIGNAERSVLKNKVGWLDILANDTHQFYVTNATGEYEGPSIKVSKKIFAYYLMCC